MKKTTIYQVKNCPATTSITTVLEQLNHKGYLFRSFNGWVGDEIDIEEFLTEYSHYRGDEILHLLTEMWEQSIFELIKDDPDFYGVTIVTIGGDE